MSFINPLIRKDNNARGGANNTQKQRHLIWVYQHPNPINFCLEWQVGEVGVVDVGEENLHRLLLHDAFDDSDLHPPVV